MLRISWTLPEGLTTYCRLTKPGMVPERTKVKACGQLVCLATVNAVKDGCASIPILKIIGLLGNTENDSENESQIITTLIHTVLVATPV
jgi:hypothetical protein